MGMLPVRIDDRTEVRVKDNVFTDRGCEPWMSLWIAGQYVTGESGPPVPDIDDATLEQAARDWYDQYRKTLIGAWTILHANVRVMGRSFRDSLPRPIRRRLTPPQNHNQPEDTP